MRDLSRLRELEAAATPSRWYVGYDDGSGETSIVARDHEDALGLGATVVMGGSPEGDIEFGVGKPADATFIAALRNAAPELLARLDRLEKVAAAARVMVDDHDETGGHGCHLEPELRAALAELDTEGEDK